jgi:predicted permease
MAIIGEWIRRLVYLLRRRAMDDDLRREMEAHQALMGEPRRFGNTLRLQEAAHDAWGWRWLDALLLDARFALRTLRHSPGFTISAVVTLALGIGVNSAMFSFVNSLLLRPLYERPDEVVGVHAPTGQSYLHYAELKESTNDLFAELTASSYVFTGLGAGEGLRQTLALAVTANYFQLFGRPLVLGRPFTNEEERLRAGIQVAVITHRLWQRLGADSDVLGRTVTVNGEPFTVVGVAREGFTGTSIPGPELWVPLGALETISASPEARSPDAPDVHELTVVGRLRPGVSAERLEAALDTVASRLQQAFPAGDTPYTLEVTRPFRLMFMPGPGSGVMTATITALLMAMPAIVLLVACLNLANLLLARGHLRRHELAIRSSLGGGRGRIARQLLTEGLLLSLAGGAAGLVLAAWAANALLATIDPVLPTAVGLPELNLDWRVVTGTIGFSVAAALLFGAWPARALTGAAATNLKRHAGEDGRQPKGVRVGHALVIGQVALSILLLASGGLFLMSAIAAASADPGFRLEGGLLVEVDPSLAGYGESRGRQAQLAVVDRLRTLPGVEAVTIASRFPFVSEGDSRMVSLAGAEDARAQPVGAVFSVVGRGYARVLGLPMLGGRDFSDAEMSPGSTEPVAIIDDALAQRLWPTASALGQLIQFSDDGGAEVLPPMRVIGIIPAVKHSFGNPRPFPHVYVPLGQHYESAMTVQLRVVDGASEKNMLAAVAGAVRSVDERVTVVRVETWRDRLDRSVETWLYRVGARVFSAFGGIALLLAVIGVYGVKSYVVSRRTREFGIRLAIGAQPRTLLWHVLREGGRVTVIGIAIGLLLALAAGQFLQSVLYGVNRFEPAVMVSAPLILLAASLLASYLPARRATRVDPTVALRAE